MKRKLKNRCRRGADVFRNMPLNGKIITILIVAVLIPLLIVSTAVFKNVYENTLGSESRFHKNQLQSITDSVDNMLKDYEASLDAIYNDERFFQNAKTVQVFTVDTLNVDSTMNMMLEQVRQLREFTAGVSFIFPDGSHVDATSGYGNFEEVIRDNSRNMTAILEGMSVEKMPVIWEAAAGDEDIKLKSNDFFSGRKNIRNIYDKNKLLGTAVIHVSELALNKIPALERYDDQSILAVLDGKGRLLWNNRTSPVLEEMMSQDIFNSEHYDSEILYEYGDYYFIYEDSQYSGWKFISIIPAGEVNRQADTFRNFFVMIAALIVCFLILCMILVRKSVVFPIKKLIVAMDQVDNLGKIGVNLEIAQKDEIGCLYQTYNRLNRRIDGLIASLKEAMYQDKEKEIKLMHSQLNPHFIYNTLESISWLAYEKNVPEISKVMNALSEILKYSVKYSDALVTFGDELKMLKNYVYIQRFRFENRFEVVYEIDEHLLEYKTIKFTFQPFVENALVHGFKNKKEHGLIWIRLYEKENLIYAEVEDNGCGMEPWIVSSVNDIHTDGIGISNIDKSLQLRFGTEYRLRIMNRPGEGTTILLRLPEMK